VEYAVDSGTQVSVRAIDARSQTRAFPDALIRELENVVAVSSDIAIQVTDIGSADLLSLALGGVAREYVESTLRSVPSWMTWEIVEILEFEDTTVHILITCPSHDADPQSASTQLV
jgi:regulator of protease activity HflC (stomatin/prohibitin superfamily)